MPRYGPYSKEIRLAQPDGRSRQGRLLTQMRGELSQQLGGSPTAAQRAMIERAAMLQLRVAMLDLKILDGTFSEYDAKTYLAWTNSLTRTLNLLGLTTPAQAELTATEALDRLHGRRSAA